MTDLQFGKALGMLENGKDHWAIELSKAGVDFMGPLTPLPWLSQILISIPGGDKDFNAYKNWAHGELQLRLQVRLSFKKCSQDRVPILRIYILLISLLQNQSSKLDVSSYSHFFYRTIMSHP